MVKTIIIIAIAVVAIAIIIGFIVRRKRNK